MWFSVIKGIISNISPKMWISIGVIVVIACMSLYIKHLRHTISEQNITIIQQNSKITEYTNTLDNLAYINKKNKDEVDNLRNDIKIKEVIKEKRVEVLLKQEVPADCTGAVDYLRNEVGNIKWEK